MPDLAGPRTFAPRTGLTRRVTERVIFADMSRVRLNHNFPNPIATIVNSAPRLELVQRLNRSRNCFGSPRNRANSTHEI